MTEPADLLFGAAVLAYVKAGGRPTAGLLATTLYTIYRVTLANIGEKEEQKRENKKLKSGNKKPKVPIVDSYEELEQDFTFAFRSETAVSPKKQTSSENEKHKKHEKHSKHGKVRVLKKKQIATLTPPESPVTVFFSSLTGTSQKLASLLEQQLAVTHNTTKLVNLDDVVDLDDYFVNVTEDAVYALVLPSYETDSPIDYFLQTLEENSTDFRVGQEALARVRYFVVGLGDKEQYPDKFCSQAAEADAALRKLGARRLFPLAKFCSATEPQKPAEWVSFIASQDFEDVSDDAALSDGSDDTLVADIEELGAKPAKETKEMVAKDSPTYKALTKQGYTVVGSHSGVKICRWTKSALRNRGSCYKYAFYGIRSHLCMETTPSLSCSNKCVFCWRHGTNPVGTNWRWQVDGPAEILQGALEGHYKKIKQMRGVPGVNAERFQEAFTVRHCALSLVGEPIFYPYINEFVEMLHARHISSFLVCNAQHPQQLQNLRKVTQLYVSIDAASRSDLKRVDRPLFRDFWERLHQCLDVLGSVQAHQRTVFRLTLVKGFNMAEVGGYADMVERGNPSLIEVKGATFCGSSDKSLTMQNIPFYEECKQFVAALNKELHSRGLDYDIAAEHAHSCCILVAHKKFYIGGKWHTHIDYDKFFQLLESGDNFGDTDYVKETPEWAYWGSEEGGFSPEDVRWKRKKGKVTE